MWVAGVFSWVAPCRVAREIPRRQSSSRGRARTACTALPVRPSRPLLVPLLRHPGGDAADRQGGGSCALQETHAASLPAGPRPPRRFVAFYMRQGFARVGDPLQLGSDLQLNWLMARAIGSGQAV